MAAHMSKLGTTWLIVTISINGGPPQVTLPLVCIQIELSLALKKGPDDEAAKAFGRADHWDLEGARGGDENGRPVPQARHQRCDFYNWKAK
jgi:hypothetical protein